MKQTIIIACTGILAALIASACGGAADEGDTKTGEEPKISYPEAEAGGTTEVGVDGYFEIRQDDDTSGELRWLFKDPPDDTLLKIIEERFDGPPATEDGGGGPGTRVWLFQAVADGETELTLEYLRPWEEDVPPTKSATYKIVIKPAPEEEEPAEEEEKPAPEEEKPAEE
jgi:predicted secreted protein